MARPTRPAPKTCDVAGCGKEARRSLSAKKVKEALPDLDLPESGRRVALCKAHYKAFRKKTKEERKLERLAW